MAARRTSNSNRLVQSLSDRDYRRLSPMLETVPLKLGDILCQAGDSIEHVYFPDAGVISLLAPADEQGFLEVGLVGRDGMFGVPVALGFSVSTLRARVQGTGSAIRMPVSQFRRVLKDSEQLQLALHRYIYTVIQRTSQAVVCNTFHLVAARLASWLLTTSDHIHSEEVTITQTLLADVLGVRRAQVSIAASGLKRSRLITYSRGDIQIRNRAQLQSAACSCYPVARELYRTALH